MFKVELEVKELNGEEYKTTYTYENSDLEDEPNTRDEMVDLINDYDLNAKADSTTFYVTVYNCTTNQVYFDDIGNDSFQDEDVIDKQEYTVCL